MTAETRYNASDNDVIDTSVAGVVRFFLSMTDDKRAIDYLLAMDAQDEWVVDREETAHRDPVVQSALHLLTDVTQHTVHFTLDMTVQFLALLGALTTSRSIYIYRWVCQKNPHFVVMVERCLLEYRNTTDANAVLVNTMMRRIIVLNTAVLSLKIYTEERMNNIIKILQEQSL